MRPDLYISAHALLASILCWPGSNLRYDVRYKELIGDGSDAAALEVRITLHQFCTFSAVRCINAVCCLNPKGATNVALL